MTTEHTKQIASTILQQMGGSRKLQAMIGSNQFTCGEKEYDGFVQPYVMFNFKMNRKMNWCKVIYEEGKDLYVMQFINQRGMKSPSVVKEYTNVFAEDLIPNFEETTGLYLYL